jgi:predicted DNA-binding transcriptional regulator AlpA
LLLRHLYWTFLDMSDAEGPVDPADLIDKRAMSTRLGVTVRGLNKIIARGEFPVPFHIGKRAYWRKLTVVSHLERLEHPSPLRRALH